MTDYKAMPEQWAQIERSQVFNGSFQACVLELRTRVEALEANSKPTPNSSQIGRSLVERVTKVVFPRVRPYRLKCFEPEARAAIREVAAWIEENKHEHWSAVSRMLRAELEQEAK
jgi:hypothetical protein